MLKVPRTMPSRWTMRLGGGSFSATVGVALVEGSVWAVGAGSVAGGGVVGAGVVAVGVGSVGVVTIVVGVGTIHAAGFAVS